MKLKQVADVLFEFYMEGRAKATALTLSRSEMQQVVIMGVGDKMRQRFFERKKLDGKNDYYYYTADISAKEFKLSDTDARGKRRAEFSDSDDFIKMEMNEDIVNVYPVSSGSCTDNNGDVITQLKPGEENFYFGADYSDFQFFVEKGKGFDTYHLPPCVDKISVERLWITDDMDVSLDMAYDISMEVLGASLKVKGFSLKVIDNPYNPKPTELRRRLEETQQPA